jgi:hypothetical protein
LHYQLLDPSQQRLGSTFVLDPANPIAVRGPQNMVNRYLKLILTPKGTDPLRHEEGTGFPYLVGGNIGKIADVQPQVLIYVQDAFEQLQVLDRRSPTLDDDERVATAELQTFRILSADHVEIFVQLTNLAGTSVSVLIPLALS